MYFNKTDYDLIRDIETVELPCGCRQYILKDVDCSKCKKRVRKDMIIDVLSLGSQLCDDCLAQTLKEIVGKTYGPR